MKKSSLLIIILFSCNTFTIQNKFNDSVDEVNINQDTLFNLAKSPKAVYIETFYRNQILSSASGFFIKYNGVSYIITNWHVVTGRETDNSIKDLKGRITDRIKLFLLSSKGKEIVINLPTYNTQYWHNFIGNDNEPYDIAVGKIELPLDCDTYENRLSVTSIKDGDSCFEIGFPKSIIKDKNNFFPQSVRGIIISDYEGKMINLNKPPNYPLKIHNAILESGSSGSPVYNMNNEIIGIHVTAACKKKITVANNQDCIGSVFFTTKAILKVITHGNAIIWK